MTSLRRQEPAAVERQPDRPATTARPQAVDAATTAWLCALPLAAVVAILILLLEPPLAGCCRTTLGGRGGRRVTGVIGVPMLLAPVFGPVVVGISALAIVLSAALAMRERNVAQRAGAVAPPA